MPSKISKESSVSFGIQIQNLRLWRYAPRFIELHLLVDLLDHLCAHSIKIIDTHIELIYSSHIFSLSFLNKLYQQMPF